MKLTREQIAEIADIDADISAGACFPNIEPTELVATSYRTDGTPNARLFMGLNSGVFYHTSETSKYNLRLNCGRVDSLAWRERDIVSRLRMIERVETPADMIAICFIASNGDSFELATRDNGRTWSVTG